MKISSFTTALLAVGITMVVARPSSGRHSDLKAKSYYYKQLAKLFFFDGDDDEQKCGYRQGYQCCKSFEKYGEDWQPLLRGINCFYADSEASCEDVGHEGYTKACCTACTRSIPAFCIDCVKLG